MDSTHSKGIQWVPDSIKKGWDEAAKRLTAEDQRRKLLDDSARERKLAQMSPEQLKAVEQWERLSDKGRRALKLRNPWDGTAKKSKAAEYNQDEVYVAEQVPRVAEGADRVVYEYSDDEDVPF